MIKKIMSCIVVLTLLLSSLPVLGADMLITNYSFESGMTSWTQTHGSGGITASSEKSHTGNNSLKILDTSATNSYGAQSDYMAATAGGVYYAYAWSYILNGTAELYIRFYNSSKTLIGSNSVSRSAPANEWSSMKTSMTAPSGTAYVAVLLYSSTANTGTAYWDDIMITPTITNLGSIVHTTAIRSATLAIDGSGKPAFYLGVNGSSGVDAKMVEVNVNTGVVQKVMSMPGAIYAHSAVTTIDNKVCMGTYPNGYLFQYTPGAASPVNLGKAISDATYIYALAAGNLPGKVYGGTYPNSGVFKYEPGANFYTFVPHPFFANSEYTYSVAYDEPNHVLYAGTGGVEAQITRLENTGGQRNDNLLPSSISGTNTAVDKLSYGAGKVFARVNPEYKEIVLDVTDNSDGTVTTVVDSVFPVSSYGVSPVYNNKVYYTYGVLPGALSAYDINTKQTESVLGSDNNPIPNIIPGYAWGFATLDDQANYPGETLVYVGHTSGTIALCKYNPTSRNFSSTLLSGLPVAPADINSLAQGPDGKIYAGGYLSGNLGAYTPMRSDLNKMIYGMSQSEGMVSQGNYLYMGVYPNARLYRYDTTQTQPWIAQLLFNIGENYLQERPFGMAQGDNKIFAGTVAASGQLKGALTIYDTITGNAQVFRDIVTDQSIVTVAYHNGYVYAGSTIGGGKNTTPVATEAKLVKMNVSTKQYTTYTMPVSSQGITAVIVGPDNKIWGLSEGYLFVFNPGTNSIEYHQQKFPGVNYTTSSQITKNGTMTLGRPGSNAIFLTLGNSLYKIDTATKAVTTLYTGTGTVNNAASDSYGNIYFNIGNQLFRWAY